MVLNNKIITYSFCESFKDKLVDHIQTEYIDKGADLSRVAIVFGGKRPALFIKRDLGKRFKHSFYPPRFFTIDEFVQYTLKKSESFHQTQDLENCFLLYQLAKKVTPQILKGREAFAQFLPWIREILKFIDQLDLENIDDSALKNIAANAEIGYDVPEDINRLLGSIVILRNAYHKELTARKTYSRGLQYLKAAQVVADQSLDEFDQILFCNFFYFHRTEEKIVKSLYERGKATLIFQGDQRKWPVLQRISKMFTSPIVEGDKPKTPGFDLQLHSGFDVHSQVGMVREILKKEGASGNTIIVLPDPNNIIPLLSEIGTSIKDFNVSMGYPLERSSLYSLFEFIFKAQLSFKEGRYYTKDYLKVLRHPFVKNLKLSSSPVVTRILIHKIEEILTGKERSDCSGSIFIDLNDILNLEEVYSLTKEMLDRLGIKAETETLREILAELHKLLFTQWESVQCFEDFAVALEYLLDTFVEKSFMDKYPLNLNIAAKIYAIKDEFQKVTFASEEFSKEELFNIFEEKMSREKVQFENSPLKGLQILGLLETRSLNFENVIIMDVNEGVLPSLSVHEPLIPREVMISLGLDRLELEEEIQRYQFMRLISSAKNVHLVYQESKDKEKSRFIEELIWEEQKAREKVVLPAVTQPNFRVDITPAQKIVYKTPEIIEFLKKHTYSASSINMYLRNPMEFYTNYVLALREQEDLLDEPEARHVGTFIHELLEDAFKPFLGKAPKIDKAFRAHFENIFETKFEEVFSKTMKSDSFLLRSIIIERLNQFLDHEQFSSERQVEKILYLENRFADVVSLPAGDIKFRYVVDRVDKMKDGTVMIVDYKTGSVDQMPKALGQIMTMPLSRQTIFENVKSFQIPLYFHYLNKQFPDAPINAALYNLRTLELHKFIDSKTNADRESINKAFLNALNFILEEILNPDIGFIDDPLESF
jgi:hypothetical protein